MVQIADWAAVVAEEKILVVDPALELEPRSQRQVTFEHFEGARAQLDDAVLAGLGPVLVALHHARLVDHELALAEVAVFNAKRDLLGRPQAREEPELVVVALRLAPVAMNGGDERLRFLNREWVGYWPILLHQAEALQRGGRVVLLGMIAVAVLESTADHADDVVVSLLLDEAFRVDDFREARVLHVLEQVVADLRAPV